jgi:hypothetical protein
MCPKTSKKPKKYRNPCSPKLGTTSATNILIKISRFDQGKQSLNTGIFMTFVTPGDDHKIRGM